MSKIDKVLIYLLRELYNTTELEEEEFLQIVQELTEDEKQELAYLFWEKLEKRKNIFKKYLYKFRLIGNKLEDLKTRFTAEELLSGL